MAWRFRTALATCAIAVLALAATSWADSVDFAGKTAQGLPVKVRVGGDGIVRRASLRWRADCRRSHARFKNRTSFLPPYRRSTMHSFADRGHYTIHDSGGFVSRVRVGISGTHPFPHRWKGTFHARVRVRRHGHPYDRCSVHSLNWSATDTS